VHVPGIQEIFTRRKAARFELEFDKKLFSLSGKSTNAAATWQVAVWPLMVATVCCFVLINQYWGIVMYGRRKKLQEHHRKIFGAKKLKSNRFSPFEGS